MSSRRSQGNLQPYPREGTSLLAAHHLFLAQTPALSDNQVLQAVDAAFDRTVRDRVGKKRLFPSRPEQFVELCVKHLRQRSGIMGAYFYSLFSVEEIFGIDAIPHEVQRQRMNIGVFYQYLIKELMRITHTENRRSNIEAVFDGSREGDIIAEVKTPQFSRGLRLYGSVKKSSDTVGGQDVPGVIRRLESEALSEKNITRPYLCVFMYAEPPGGRLKSYTDSRSLRNNREGYPFSQNCESWEPGFIFPYISGRAPIDIYKIALSRVEHFLPFYTVDYRAECAILLKNRLMELGLINSSGKIDTTRFLEFIMSNKPHRKIIEKGDS